MPTSEVKAIAVDCPVCYDGIKAFWGTDSEDKSMVLPCPDCGKMPR